MSRFTAILLYTELLAQVIALFWPVSSSTQSGIWPKNVTEADPAKLSNDFYGAKSYGYVWMFSCS